MTRRLPDPPERRAPLAPPAPPGPPGERSPLDPEDPTEPDSEDWIDLEPDLDDLDTEAGWDDVPDDADDGTWPADEDPGDLEDLPTLDASGDDHEDEGGLSADERPLDDDLEDLSAADDDDLPVLSFRPAVRIDGQTVPGRAEPTSARTVWRGAPFTGARRVALEVGSLRWSADVIGEPGSPAEVVLGCDTLSGRFLLRP